MMLNSVDLPEPFGPITPVIDPARHVDADGVERDAAGKALRDVLDGEDRCRS